MNTRLLTGLWLATLLGAADRDTRVADAAQRGDGAAVGALVRAKADVDAPLADGTTALHWAAFNDDLELLRLLVDAGANPKAITRVGGLTPLHMAATNGTAPVIEALLKAGADPDTATADGATPLMLAAASGSADSVIRLLDRGARVTWTRHAHRSKAAPT